MNSKINAGKILKQWAIGLLIIGIAFSVLILFFSSLIGGTSGVLLYGIIAAAFALSSTAISLFLFAFGEFVDKVCSIDNKMSVMIKPIEEESKVNKEMLEKEKKEILKILEKKAKISEADKK